MLPVFFLYELLTNGEKSDIMSHVRKEDRV